MSDLTSISEYYTQDVLHNLALSIIKEAKYGISDMLPSEFAEKYVILDKSVSPARSGNFSFDYTPYNREILDCIHHSSPTKEIVVMKSAQIGVSQGVIINGILYKIVENPSPILFLSGTKELSKEFVDTRLEPAIESVGARHLLRSHKKNKSGDTVDRKEFIGGFLKFGGQKSLGSLMRQTSVDTAFFDDWDEARDSKQGGSAYELTQTRAITAGMRQKYFYISTPEIEQTSQTYRLYKMGDQRKWHIPCPRCGERVYLEWRPVEDNGKFLKVYSPSLKRFIRSGIHYELEKGRVIQDSVMYRCYNCGRDFNEREKFSQMLNGKHIATAESQKDGLRSYHLSGLLAPKGQRNWYQLAETYNLACPESGKKNTKKYHSFRNTAEGFPFKEVGKKVKSEKIAKNSRAYQVGVIPDILCENDGNGKIELITTAFDLNGIKDDARVDYEVVAWSTTGCSYSIDQGSLGTFKPYAIRKGMNKSEREQYDNNREKLDYELNSPNSVWIEVTRIINKFYHGESGKEYKSIISLIDVSNTYTETTNSNQRAYQYIDSKVFEHGRLVYGIKGKSDIKRTYSDNPYFKKGSERSNLLIIDVNSLKNRVAEDTELEVRDGIQDPFFMNFPEPRDGKYSIRDFFDHFSAEQQSPKYDANGREVGFEWKKVHEHVQNHHLDTRVYNVAAFEVIKKLVTQECDYPDTWEAFCKINEEAEL